MSALNKKSFLTYLKEGGIYVVLLVLLAIIIFQDPTFLSLLNLSNILTQSSVRIIIALGVAGLIVTQGTDLSAGRQVGLAAVVAATLLQSMENANKVFPEMATMPIIVVVLIVCVIGAIIGLVNGIIIAYLNVTPFITTLGTMIIVYGINSLYYDFVGASPISGFDSGFSTFAQGFIALGSFRLSYITFYALIAVAFVWVLWNKTTSVKTFSPSAETLKPRKCPGQRCAEPADHLCVVWRVLCLRWFARSRAYRLGD